MKPIKLRQGSPFFKRHSRFISFIGALIVFGTFIIKEGIRENLKSLVDTIDSAENTFLADRDNNVIQETLRSQSRTLARLENVSRKRPNFAKVLMNDGRLMNVSLDIGKTVQDDIDDVSGLQFSLHRLLNAIPQLKSSAIEYLDKQYERNTEAYAVWLSSGVALDEKWDQQKQQDALRALLFEEMGLSYARSVLQSSMENILKKAEMAKAKAEEKYKWATWLSYGAYTLGWGLGLAGRLYGGGGIIGGD
jgi:hypothetical protein